MELSADGMRARTPGLDSFVAWTNTSPGAGTAILVYQSDRLFQSMPVRAVTPAMKQVFGQHMGHKPRR